MISLRRFPSTILFVTLLSLLTSTNSIALTVNGTVNGDKFGLAVANIGDFNGDNFPDLLVGAPDASPAGLSQAGQVKIISGANGNTLWTRNGPRANMDFGAAVAAIGDINNDGRQDFLIGAPGADNSKGAVLVYSGTGALLKVYRGTGGLFGYAVAAAGDLNGDGRPDFWISAIGQAKVFAYSGSNFQLIRTITSNISYEFGRSIAGNCRFNNDAVADLVVGAPGTVINNKDIGAVFVYSGVDGSLLKQYKGGDPGQVVGPYGLSGIKFGSAVACPDVDNDGRNDVAIGVPFGEDSTAGKGNRGVVYVYRAAQTTANPTFTFLGVNGNDSLGSAVSSAGDVNGDGRDEIAAGAPFHNIGTLLYAGMVRIYSGSTGAVLSTVSGNNTSDQFGLKIFPIGDLNGNNLDEIAVTSTYDAQGGWAGQIDTY